MAQWIVENKIKAEGVLLATREQSTATVDSLIRDNLPLETQDRGDWFVLFPNFAFEIFPDQVDVFIAWPQGAERCRETIALYFVDAGATAEKYSAARAHVLNNWNDLNHEDIGIIERMQSGRRSDGFDGGVLSPTGIRRNNISHDGSVTQL